MSRHQRSTLAVLAAGLLSLTGTGLTSNASATVPPAYHPNPGCADIGAGDFAYRSTYGVDGSRTGATVLLDEGFGPMGNAPSCRDVTYTFTVVDSSTGQVIETQARRGQATFPESFAVAVPASADGTYPRSVCLSGTTQYQNAVIDAAPDSGCVPVGLDGAPPGLAWH